MVVCKSLSIEWATENSKDPAVLDMMSRLRPLQPNGWHWSRLFEFSYALAKGEFAPKQWVLDAGGGVALLQFLVSEIGAQVVNVDLSVSDSPPLLRKNKIASVIGNMQDLAFQDEVFDRVVCISVLEEVIRPFRALEELWRVLKPGGKLIITMDIINTPTFGSRVNCAKADEICQWFGSRLPTKPFDILQTMFPVDDPDPGDPSHVQLNILCITAIKG